MRNLHSIVQSYLSSPLANKGGSVAILSDNGTEFKNKVLNEVCYKLDIERLFSNPFHPQGNAKMEMYTISKKGPSPNLWTTEISTGMSSFHLLVTVVPYFQAVIAPNFHSSLYFNKIQQKDTCLTLTIVTGIIATMKGK